MDKPTDRDLSESIALMRDYQKRGVVRDGSAEPTLTAALKLAAAYIALLDNPKPAPEIIIGNGVTVLRPGVWYARRRGDSEYFTFRDGCKGVNGVTYTRIGDVPGEA